MTGIEAVEPVAATNPAPPRDVRFLGQEGPYWRLLIRGAVLLLFTLGSYRFWLTTDIRRFLWGHTELAGETLEYTGTALELLIGFLIAIALLVPLYALFFLVALDLGILGELSGLLAFVILAWLSQFALYRARRYRLTRTIYRGVRFHQTGSAWRYAVYAMLWWVLIVATAGLAYPWAQASLEGYKMRHSFYGDLPGRFEGSALSLFFRGLPLWLLVVGPSLLGAAAAVLAIDWPALAEAASQSGSGLAARIEATNPGFATAIVFAVMAGSWAALAAAVLYPAFQALVLRWWSSGLRFGEVAVTSRLRTGQIYRAYFRFLLYGGGFAVAMIVVGSLALVFVEFFAESDASAAGEIAATVILVVGYVVAALGYSTIYQATVKLALWRLGMESLELTGVAALDRVKAAGKPTSAVGEGLADALQVGGF